MVMSTLTLFSDLLRNLDYLLFFLTYGNVKVFFFFFFFFFLNKWFKLIKLNLANPGKCDLPNRPFRSCYIVARYWCSDLIDQNNGRSEKSCYPFLIFRIHNFDHADNKNMIDLNSGNSKIIYAYGLALLFLHH